MQELQAGCKANLFLRILGRRSSDGLHQLQSLFYPLSKPRDRILVSRAAPGKGLELSCTDPELEGEGNILFQAYQAFAEQSGLKPDLHVHLEKNIPQGAGLGGGSSDAARLLLFLQENFQEQTKGNIDLASMACRLGADVSFFLQNRPAWVEGAGEKITSLVLDLSQFSILVVWPGIHISTAQAYALWDSSQEQESRHQLQYWSLTSKGSGYTNLFPASGRLLWNSFEQVVFDRYPKLQYIKANLLARGAAAAVLSGSGSAMLGFYRSRPELESACAYLDMERIMYFV
ncbi:MAG: 4-(cytidine 5'-diphospho)-2-C-methyl-D-erythritol kinase [Desulfohalobiaceae bacterium]